MAFDGVHMTRQVLTILDDCVGCQCLMTSVIWFMMRCDDDKAYMESHRTPVITQSWPLSEDVKTNRSTNI